MPFVPQVGLEALANLTHSPIRAQIPIAIGTSIPHALKIFLTLLKEASFNNE